MNAIVVIAHRRPEYLKKCLRAIQACRGLGEWLVTIQVDGLNKDPLVEECRRVARESDLMAALTRPMMSGKVPACIAQSCIQTSGGNLGVNYNNFDAIGAAFSGYRPPEMVLVVEEDVILSLDALELCEWFYRHPERDNYACLLLHAFSDKPQDPSAMQECMRFNPWGWAVTREMWRWWFKPNWNCKTVSPFGWDWAMGYIIQKNGLKCLRPRMSRVRNIGREGGVYETPEHFDSFHAKTLVHDGGAVEYKIVDRLGTYYRNTDMEQWVKEELAAGHSATTRLFRF